MTSLHLFLLILLMCVAHFLDSFTSIIPYGTFKLIVCNSVIHFQTGIINGYILETKRIGISKEMGSVPNGILNPHGHLWQIGNVFNVGLLRVLLSSPQCGFGKSAHQGHILTAKALASSLLTPKMTNGTPYGLVVLKYMCTHWPQVHMYAIWDWFILATFTLQDLINNTDLLTIS